MAEEVHTAGSKVWIRDDVHSWVKADVVKSDKDLLIVKSELGDERKVKAGDAPLQNQDTRGVEDMTRLSYLHEPGVLWNLKVRYMLDDIYTYTGTILIAVNPFAALPHLYGSHMMDQYRGADLGELSPHVYAIADAAYRQMVKEWKGQSILVSGESGAGKTETSKLIMKYLAYMGGQRATTGGRSVEEQVLESNPLLEAFGNAKTVRNNNSSRFGKYVEINFNKDGVISGAAIRTYLLERSRVVAVNDPERSYHIFYQLCEGASPEEKAAWFLKPAREFNYLNQSTCFEIPGVNNAEEYQATIRAMETVGIPAPDREAILRTVAAILHLGNVDFVADKSGDEASVVAPGASEYHAEACAKLLGVEPAALKHAMTTRTRQTPEGPITSPINVRAAVDTRDSLAKIIYSKLFDWLVERINNAIGEDKNCAASVGVLDIYGFESFKTNDFEQFCINLANEKLQQHFNQHVFKQEQAEYEREAIDWSYIEFVDNQDALDLIEGKTGILDLLDEQCRFPSASSNDFAQKLYGAPSCKDSKRFSKPRTSQSAFTIDHYAGAVTYECKNFLDKNKDFVVAEHQILLQNSEHDFVRQLFPPPPEEPAENLTPGKRTVKSGNRFNSVGSQFKKQLHDLMTQLHAMEPHYVRCIKPNEKNQPMLFENGNVLQQLRCGGVLEAVRINCAGFPSKRPYADFVDHFWPLSPDLLHTLQDDRDIAEGIIKKAGISGFQLGKSKVFLRAGQMAVMDKLRTEKMNSAAVTVQRYTRGWLTRHQVARQKEQIRILQAAVRARAARLELRALRREKAAVTIQTKWRGHKELAHFKEAYRVVLRIQSIWRGARARKQYTAMRRENAAKIIQTCWRRHVARSAFLKVKQAAIVVQCRTRCKAAKRELRKLHSEARAATKLLEDKKVLEVKMKELQNTLEVVQNQRNELRQQLKDEKLAVAEAERRLHELEEDKENAVSAAKAEAQQVLEEEQTKRTALSEELGTVRQQLADVTAKAAKDKSDLENKLKSAQDYIEKLHMEKSQLNEGLRQMKEELVQRLQNACEQRDEARGQRMILEKSLEEMKLQVTQLQEQLKQKDAQMANMVSSPVPTITSPTTPASAASNGYAANLDATAWLQAAANKALARQQSKAESPLANQLNASPGYTTPVRSLSGRGFNSPAAAEEDGRAAEQSDMERRARELNAKQQQLVAERRKAEEDKLLTAISNDMGFSKGRPVAALVVFRCCLQWRSFQAERTSMFDRIIQVIGGQIEKQQDDNGCLAYWLTNTVTLLHLLQKNIKPASNSQFTRRGSASASTPSTAGRILGGLFGRSVQPGEASIHGGGVGGFRQVEAKYPALLFKQQLDAFVQKIFPMMRDNVKKQITPMLTGCIHTPKGRAAGSSLRRSVSTDPNQPQTQGLNQHWQDILGAFDQLLETLKANNVPVVLVQALFKQLFSFVNVQLFNQLLLRRECCSFSNGEYVKTGLSHVEEWIGKAGEQYMGHSLDELRFIRQAVTFLVIGNKPKKTLDDITRDLCPQLSIQQLYRISTMYWDDKYNTETVSQDVLTQMKQLMVDNNSHASHSFLLDDDSTLPFQAQEVLSQMDDKDLNAGLSVPEQLKPSESEPSSSFAFLEKELRINPQPAAS